MLLRQVRGSSYGKISKKSKCSITTRFVYEVVFVLKHGVFLQLTRLQQELAAKEEAANAVEIRGTHESSRSAQVPLKQLLLVAVRRWWRSWKLAIRR